GFDDDDPPEFVRERSIIVPIGEGKYVSIPMPLGFHVIPSTSRILTEWALSGFKDTTKRFGDFAALFADTFNPIGNAGWSMQTLAPTALDPFAALAENRDWTGKPIAQEDFNSLRPTPGFSRAKDTASEIAKALAYWINRASGGTDYKPGLMSPTPDQIDYLIGQVTGGVGREYLKAEQTAMSAWTGEELAPHKIPLLGRFYGDTTGQSSEATRFYNNLREINLHRSEVEGRRKDGGDVAGYLRDNPVARLGASGPVQVESQVRKLRQAKRDAIERGDTARVKEIDERLTAVMSRFNERAAALEG
ncbi:LPD38 domain-containing protein, partial [Thauera propionica]|uniref:LPD38 domain-containing protein n=1 Tax=Thauera propionica TaxID=2019431 RepID=UPI0023F36963